MLVRRLYELGLRLQEEGELPPSGYKRGYIRWIIELDRNGRFLRFSRLVGDKGEENKGMELEIPALAKNRTGQSPDPVLLADNAQFVIGYDSKENPKLTFKCHKAFVALINKAADELNHQGLEVVRRFYRTFSLDEISLPEDINPIQLITFDVAGDFPMDDPDIQEWWLAFLCSQSERVPGVCSVSGEEGYIVKLHPQRLENVPGMNSAPLVTAKEPATWSYGKEASYNCPVSFEAAELYGKALNHLLRDDYSHWISADNRMTHRKGVSGRTLRRIGIGPAVYVFWTKDENAIEGVDSVMKPDASYVHALLDSVEHGKDCLSKNDSAVSGDLFHATSLKANGGRVQIRDWIELTVEKLKLNIRRYFQLMKLEDYRGESRYYGLRSLAECPYHNAGEMEANVPRALISCALNGTRLPDWLLFQAIKRNHRDHLQLSSAEGSVKVKLFHRINCQLRLIKMWLHQRYDNGREEYMTVLDTTCQEPGYVLGRLLAMLGSIQGAALGYDLNVTLVDRFYGPFGITPKRFLKALMDKSRHHLRVLRREKPGLHNNMSRDLGEIMELLSTDALPGILNRDQQALYVLGFHHQETHIRRKIEAGKKPDMDTDLGSEDDSFQEDN